MVKGISRQVIVLHSEEQSLFEQAIFILKDSAVHKGGITDEQLLREAGRLMGSQKGRRFGRIKELTWAGMGAAVTALLFLLL